MEDENLTLAEVLGESDVTVDAQPMKTVPVKLVSASSRFKDLILEGGRTDEEIFKICQEEYGLSDDKRAYVSWYRNWLKKNKPEVELPEKLGGTKLVKVHTPEEIAAREAKAAERAEKAAAGNEEKEVKKFAKEEAKRLKAETKEQLRLAREEQKNILNRSIAATAATNAANAASGVELNDGGLEATYIGDDVEACDPTVTE